MALKAKKAGRANPTGVAQIEDQVTIRHREALVLRLREGEGLTFEEIAERAGVTVGTVHNDFKRVSDRLLASMAENFPRWRGEHIVRVAELYQRCLREVDASKRAKIRRRMQRAVPSGGAEGASNPTVTELQQMEEQNEVGEPRFLEQAVKAAALLADLLGMTSKSRPQDEEEGGDTPLAAGLISGPIIEISATALDLPKEVRAALERHKAESKKKAATK